MLWFMLTLAFLVIVGNALMLLRTAKKPKLPESYKPKPEQDDWGGGW
jgi:hypothetical protein